LGILFYKLGLGAKLNPRPKSIIIVPKLGSTNIGKYQKSEPMNLLMEPGHQ